MKKPLDVFLAITIISCGNNGWTTEEKNNYMIACINSYDKIKPDSQSEARCYCIEALNLTMEIYPKASDADTKMTMSEVMLISEKAKSNLKKINNMETCL